MQNGAHGAVVPVKISNDAGATIRRSNTGNVTWVQLMTLVHLMLFRGQIAMNNLVGSEKQIHETDGFMPGPHGHMPHTAGIIFEQTINKSLCLC